MQRIAVTTKRKVTIKNTSMLNKFFSQFSGDSSGDDQQGSQYDSPVGNGRPDRRSMLHFAFEFAAKSNLDGCYAEFGCFQGTSFSRAFHSYEHWLEQCKKNKWNMTRQTMFAFDSFAGLPTLDEKDQVEDYTLFFAGQYACSEDDFRARLAEQGVDMELVKTVPGFYEDSLTPELKKELNFPSPVVVHIDCDLRSSAATVLDFLTDRVQDGVVFMFDDYYCYRGNPRHGVRRAFDDWLESTGYVSTHYMNYAWAGAAFIVSVLDDE